MEGA
jgi:hypothetical protein